MLLDTNFLLLPLQQRIDIYDEIPRLIGSHVHLIILPQVLNELKWLEKNGTSKEKSTAKSSLILAKLHCEIVEDLPSSVRNLDADSALLWHAKEMGALVATNDGELRRKLVNQGNRVIFVRKLAVLALTES